MKLKNYMQRMPYSRMKGEGPNTSESTTLPRGQPMTDAEANEILQRLQVGDLRSTFARALFPYDPRKYKTHGQWAREVGTRVSADIHNNPSLRIAMQKAGYKAGMKGYTHSQQIILIKFYRPPNPL